MHEGMMAERTDEAPVSTQMNARNVWCNVFIPCYRKI